MNVLCFIVQFLFALPVFQGCSDLVEDALQPRWLCPRCELFADDLTTLCQPDKGTPIGDDFNLQANVAHRSVPFNPLSCFLLRVARV
jgi:hypothetical protein